MPSRNIRTDPKLEADDLKAQGLVNEKTRIVCSAHVSNVLGSATDVAAVCRAIKSINPDKLVGVDGVAYAPHAPVDVRAFGVDLYYFSWYKVCGPHPATGFVNKSAFQQLEYLGSDFLPKEQTRYILGLTSGSYEAIQSISAVVSYVDHVGGTGSRSKRLTGRKSLYAGFDPSQTFSFTVMPAPIEASESLSLASGFLDDPLQTLLGRSGPSQSAR